MKHLNEKITLAENDSSSLVDRVEQSIIDYIKDNALKVGDALPKEIEFAESLGVSRTAIREAMLRLRTLGLVESRKHRGMVIMEPDLVHNFEKMLDPALVDIKKLSNLFELRMMLEVGMADFVFARKTSRQLKELEDIVINSEEQRCDSLNFYLEAEKQFHGKLYEMAGNDILKKFQDIFMPIFQYVHDMNRYQAAYILPEGGKYISHRDLFEELKHGTPSSFRELMREHLNPHYIKVLGISC
ncbi:FadR/GntR family transcriptional regulator [Capnocytophaga sp. G2]|uniref:FadR/GntR family transcriptional regulator n=1 Tax=Capnocytophaga sp. G2 TaxID=3110695 RepID=UPI002B492DA0|nr:GntR family transcriptional regulator [Capnocytophaga sp. G2]MEB3004943.1 GntR family transcriptional regulator [Capnocytophaga sp. G2]